MPRDDGSRAAGRKLASVINLPLCAAAHALTLLGFRVRGFMAKSGIEFGMNLRLMRIKVVVEVESNHSN